MDTRCIYLLATLALAAATNVSQCPGKSFENLSSAVQLMPCKSLPCRLKKGSDQHITIEFTPEKDIVDLRNHVTAQVLGVALPFIGVDGESVCGKIKTEAGEDAPCPLKAGTKYVYKDAFPVLRIYPSITTEVSWALQAKERDVICFKVPVKIQ